MSELTTTYEWKTIPWHKLERKVFKLQKQIYQAASGVHDKHPVVEKPDESNDSRPVLQTSRVGDCPT